MREPEENVRVQQVLKLVDELKPQERDEVLYQLKLQDLRREIRKGIDAADRGELVTLEELNEHLDAIQQKYMERQK